MKDEIEELDKLAREFIIGYAPLTPKQKDLLEKIRNLETQLSALESRKKRMERVLTVLYGHLMGRK